MRTETEDPERRRLAGEIAAQKKEIVAMTRSCEPEYGAARAAPAEAGGHPAGHGG